ncbi:MAG: hypothetical protein ABIO49_01810 [Dokdonella sp.]
MHASRLPGKSVLVSFLLLTCASASTVEGAEGLNDAAIKTRVVAHAEVAGIALESAKVEFMCTTGNDGALSVAVILPEPDAIKDFPLGDFEGPDGIGEKRAIATWSLAGEKSVTAKGTISGWYGVDGDGFLLAATSDSANASDFKRLLRRYLDAATQPLRLVVDSPKKGAALEVEVVLGDRRASVEAIIAPCLKAHK